jgi:hypothetical protein
MRRSDVEIVGSVDVSEMPPRRGGGMGGRIAPLTQQVLDDAAAGRVTVLRLANGIRAGKANEVIAGGLHRTLKRRGLKVNTSTKLDADGTLLLYVHCTPIDQNGHQP